MYFPVVENKNTLAMLQKLIQFFPFNFDIISSSTGKNIVGSKEKDYLKTITSMKISSY